MINDADADYAAEVARQAAATCEHGNLLDTECPGCDIPNPAEYGPCDACGMPAEDCDKVTTKNAKGRKIQGVCCGPVPGRNVPLKTATCRHRAR